MEKVQKIKQEIERLKNHTLNIQKSTDGLITSVGRGRVEAFNDILKFIDSLPEEPISEAVETTIVNDWQYGKDQDHAVIPAIHQRIDGFNVGDKVKIIIVKED